jgi:hypothetical protein
LLCASQPQVGIAICTANCSVMLSTSPTWLQPALVTSPHPPSQAYFKGPSRMQMLHCQR